MVKRFTGRRREREEYGEARTSSRVCTFYLLEIAVVALAPLKRLLFSCA
jgi:hypothetical protein